MGSDYSNENLTVFPSRENPEAWWCAEHGEVVQPSNWEFLQSGDAYITRKVKQMGPYWLAKRHSRSLKLNVTIGILAPKINIEKASQMAEETKLAREAARESSRRNREKSNLKYVNKFRHAVIEYLDFAPEHAELANNIASEATKTATEVGSERVGRTAKLTMEEKSMLAARATIRHLYTDYEELLRRKNEPYGFFDKLDRDDYREVRQEAEHQVDEFISEHRRKGRVMLL